MAVVTISIAVDMAAADFLDFTADPDPLTSPNEIFLDYGDFQRRFIGTGFEFDGDLVTDGTLTGYEEGFTGEPPYFVVSGLSLSAVTVQDFIMSNDGRGLLEFASAGNDSLTGSAEADRLFTDIGNDTIDAGGGADSAWGMGGNDSLTGGADGDNLFGNLGSDTLMGGDGNDTMRGHFDVDLLLGEAGDDRVIGGASDDTVDGGIGSDTVDGMTGNDSLTGGAGNDTVRGQAGVDTLSGGDADDNILGMNGNDSMLGGAGNDTLVGGNANDTMTGGDGVDVFVFAALQGSNLITDFADGVDVISMVGIGSLADLAITDTASGARIQIASEGGAPTLAITLTDIAANQLTATDFFFS